MATHTIQINTRIRVSGWATHDPWKYIDGFTIMVKVPGQDHKRFMSFGTTEEDHWLFNYDNIKHSFDAGVDLPILFGDNDEVEFTLIDIIMKDSTPKDFVMYLKSAVLDDPQLYEKDDRNIKLDFSLSPHKQHLDLADNLYQRPKEDILRIDPDYDDNN